MSGAMKRTSEWVFSNEISSDVTVDVGGTSFSLHKFPLVSKCGYARKIVSNSSDSDLSVIEMLDFPGGAEAFELAAKFCYGINFEITTENIAMLRCAAEFLEMTEDYAVSNLIQRTEAYTNEVALKSLSGAVSILRSSENLLPIAEKVRLVSRSIDTISTIACKDSQSHSDEPASSSVPVPALKPIVDWWAEDLTILRVDMFQRVLIAMMAKGFNHLELAPILMLYAQKSLRGLDMTGKAKKRIEPQQEHEKRVVLETIVSLLPREKNGISVSFLSMLLRASIFLETTVACRLDLEKRMAAQLGQAVIDDLLIPSYSFTGDTTFDVDIVKRISASFFACESSISPCASEMERVARLLESYLSEIASDPNLSVSKFVSLAERIPENSRIKEDGIYRAIDIYLKAHPSLNDMERKKVCSVMDCHKLSREACAHAAKNDRLPAQTVVQVLYYEQQRLREAMDHGNESGLLPAKMNPVAPDEAASLRQENQGLKVELLKMKMRLDEMEMKSLDNAVITPKAGSPVGSSSSTSASAGKPPLPPKHSFMSSVSKKFGKLIRIEGMLSNPRVRNKASRDRRHSIS